VTRRLLAQVPFAIALGVVVALALVGCGAGGSPPPAPFSAAHDPAPLPWRLEPITVYGIPAAVTVRP
jgi:hypothetical protein